MSEFILRSRHLSFDERAEVERLVPDVTDDPDGAAWTIVVLRSVLERNGLSVEIVHENAEAALPPREE
jgi:hypothetical protein